MCLVQCVTGTEIGDFPKSGFEHLSSGVVLSKNMGPKPRHDFKYFSWFKHAPWIALGLIKYFLVLNLIDWKQDSLALNSLNEK